MEIERRTNLGETSLEYRDDPQTGMKQPVITGYAAVFRSESRNLGGFTEILEPGAFSEVLASQPDVIGCYNHDKNFLLGRTSSGTMTLSEDDRGLKYTIYPPEARADVIQAVDRRDVIGSSFSFMCRQEDESWSGSTRGMRQRTIKKISLLDDVGPVVRPAYEGASVIVSRRTLEMALGDHFRPNLTMANAAKRGLKCGNTAENDQLLVGIAAKIAERCVITPEEIASRDGVFKRCLDAKTTGWLGSPAFFQYQMAGGDSGAKWVARRYSEQAGEAFDPVMPPKETESDDSSSSSAYDLTPANDQLHEAIETIAEANGQWPQDGANGAHYMRESPFADAGLVCANCVMFKGGGKCEAVAGEIEAGGVCKLWVIPADKMTMAPADRSEAPPETTPAVVTPVIDYAGRAASLRAALLESVARQ